MPAKVLLLARVFLIASLALATALVVRPASSVQGAPALQVLASVGGQPDDIATDPQGRLVWGDLARGTVERFDGKHIVTLARGLSVPEGIVIAPRGTIFVAEQGRDRIDRLGAHGSVHVVYTLQPVAGQEGVDGIGRDPRTGDLLVPDSPRGTLLRMTVTGKKARLIVRGLGRPVDAAVDARRNVWIPDENLGTLVEVTPRGQVSYHGRLSTPDDVVIDRSGHIWITTLGDGGLWEMTRGGTPQEIISGLANPQGLTLDRCGDPIVVDQNTARLARLLLNSASAHCRL